MKFMVNCSQTFTNQEEVKEMKKEDKETWASPSTKETCAGPLILSPRNAFLFTRRIIPTSEKKWTVIHSYSPNGGHLAVSVSKMVTTCIKTLGFNETSIDESVCT